MSHQGTFALPGPAWRWACQRIKTLGERVVTEDGQETIEIRDLILTVENPLQGWPIAGSGWDIPALDVYVKDQILGDENKTGFAYTYGERIKPRLNSLINQLRDEPTTRRGVIAIWDGMDYSKIHPPCWMSLVFLLRGDELHLSAYVRSNDIKQAWPANAYGLAKLMECVAYAIGEERYDSDREIKAGSLTIHSVSAHIYTGV